MRKSWDEYFLSIARNVAERSTCNRKQVGCVIVRDRAILSTGYAGSIRGQPHCLDVGCEIGPDGGCQRTIHAEINAVAQAAKHGTCIDGATAYVTLSPCYNCFKMLVNSGIRRVVFDEAYRRELDAHLITACGMEYQQVQLDRVDGAMTRDALMEFLDSSTDDIAKT
jgi:dCMP deaminase